MTVKDGARHVSANEPGRGRLTDPATIDPERRDPTADEALEKIAENEPEIWVGRAVWAVAEAIWNV